VLATGCDAPLVIHKRPLPYTTRRRPNLGDTRFMSDPGESAKAEWVSRLPNGPASKDDLARLVDEDGAHDAAEVSYYESVADPTFALLETQERRFRAQFRRRIRHRLAKRRDRPSE